MDSRRGILGQSRKAAATTPPGFYKANYMVDDVLVHWDQMKGDDPLIQQINALLTWAFILRRDVPADECHSEAVVIPGMQGLVEAGEWELRVLWFLKERFATVSNLKTGEKKVVPSFEKQCDRIAPLVLLLVESYLPDLGAPPVDDLPMFLVSNGFELGEDPPKKEEE